MTRRRVGIRPDAIIAIADAIARRRQDGPQSDGVVRHALGELQQRQQPVAAQHSLGGPAQAGAAVGVLVDAREEQQRQLGGGISGISGRRRSLGLLAACSKDRRREARGDRQAAHQGEDPLLLVTTHGLISLDTVPSSRIEFIAIQNPNCRGSNKPTLEFVFLVRIAKSWEGAPKKVAKLDCERVALGVQWHGSSHRGITSILHQLNIDHSNKHARSRILLVRTIERCGELALFR